MRLFSRKIVDEHNFVLAFKSQPEVLNNTYTKFILVWRFSTKQYCSPHVHTRIILAEYLAALILFCAAMLYGSQNH